MFVTVDPGTRFVDDFPDAYEDNVELCRWLFRDIYVNFEIKLALNAAYNILKHLTKTKNSQNFDGEIEEDLLNKPEKERHFENLVAYLDDENVPESERPALIEKIKIEIARITRPKWVGRLERGGELATLSAPLFLKRVHADYIGSSGAVENEAIRAIDPDLMKAVEAYISARRTRAKEKNIPFTLGDAEGLEFVLTRPGASSLIHGRNRPSV
jgi:hypothetical protein